MSLDVIVPQSAAVGGRLPAAPSGSARPLPLLFYGDCKHALVATGQQADCPECVWRAAIGYVNSRQTDPHPAMVEVMEHFLAVCERALPPALRPQVRDVARKGNWYALRFVRRWKAQQSQAAGKGGRL